jgi:DNA-binding MarR family transcriptional regulator
MARPDQQPLTGSSASAPSERDRIVDSLLVASQALVGLAARSVVAVDPDVTLPQYRALAVLAANGPQKLAALAKLLGVHASTATRLCDRLVAKELIDRTTAVADRREVALSLTPRGCWTVDQVVAHRRAAIERVVDRIPATQRDALIVTLEGFRAAIGEGPEQAWSLGWAHNRDDIDQPAGRLFGAGRRRA